MSLHKGGPEYLHLLSKKLQEKGILTTCVTCVEFSIEGKDPVCAKWGQRIPIRVIPTGCVDWNENIPF